MNVKNKVTRRIQCGQRPPRSPRNHPHEPDVHPSVAPSIHARCQAKYRMPSNGGRGALICQRDYCEENDLASRVR